MMSTEETIANILAHIKTARDRLVHARYEAVSIGSMHAEKVLTDAIVGLNAAEREVRAALQQDLETIKQLEQGTKEAPSD